MSDGVNYQFNGIQYWNVKEGRHDQPDSPTPGNAMVGDKRDLKPAGTGENENGEAFLMLTVPPETRFRYRYDTEMSGTHGSLQGTRTGSDKSVPTVDLVNYSGEALIRVTLVTCQEKNEHHPHPHSLFVKEKLYQKNLYENWDGKSLTKTGHYPGPHYIRVGRQKQGYTARFEGMCIINSKKENFHSSVREKLQKRLREETYGSYNGHPLRMDVTEEDLASRIEEAVNAVDVDFVSLCFEAFREENGKLRPICGPVFSEPIGNAKSAKTGKLKISRINKCSGSCSGGDEIWMLVEKINKKGLIVRFWEEYNGSIVWESSLEGDDLILHHQYAIIFKTPAYRDVGISSEVEVLMRLERTSQPNQPCDFSEPITFVYEPLKSKLNKGDHLCKKESILTPVKSIHIKRPRTDSSSMSAGHHHHHHHHGKCRGDDLDLEGMNFEDSMENYIEQILFNDKDVNEFDQAWAKFNVEEFLQFITSDDVDMPLQRDGLSLGPKHRRDLLYKLYLLYTKLDESDIRKLTEDVSNFRVSKKDEVASRKSNAEKDQVQDAASTLLSLRSRAMANSNTSDSKNLRNQKPGAAVESPTTQVNQEESGNGSVTRVHGPGSRFSRGQDDDDDADTRTKCVRNCTGKKFLPENGNGFEADSRHGSGETAALDSANGQVIKTEVDASATGLNLDALDDVCRVLNESGSWKYLADMWDCAYIVPSAKVSSNPAKCLFRHVEKLHGGLEVDVLRYVLNAVNERNALQILDEITKGKRFH